MKKDTPHWCGVYLFPKTYAISAATELGPLLYVEEELIRRSDVIFIP